MADNTIKAIEQAEDVIRLDRPFDYEGYQVVRQEFFAHVNEPAVTFNNYKFYGNAACLRKFPPQSLCRCSSTGSESSWCCALAGRKTGRLPLADTEIKKAETNHLPPVLRQGV